MMILITFLLYKVIPKNQKFNYNYAQMPQRKKNQNKENYKAIKKTTLQQINYTQQLHIPTYATMDLRQAGRSIQLKKSSSKKPASRKSRCISVKQSGPQAPLNIKQLLKQFKSMKLIQQRSKSPHSSKSKPKSRKSTKRITQTQNCSKSNSELNLTAKVERTLQKLKQSCYFKDEQDSEIPLMSTSEAFTQQQKRRLQYIVSGQNFQDINIRQLRLFCKSSEPGMRMSLDYFKGNIYEIMARRIQRAWRRYRTHKLVQRYASIAITMDSRGGRSHEISRNDSQVSAENNKQKIMISSEQLYPQQMQQRKVTYISNLQQQSYEQVEKQKQELEDQNLISMKKHELQKWEQIISLINASKAQNPAQAQKLLAKLMNKSERNKRILEMGPIDAHEQQDDAEQRQQQYDGDYEEHQQQQQIEQQKDDYQTPGSHQRQEEEFLRRQQPEHKGQVIKRKIQQQSSVSEDSMKQIEEEFNSKKYIQYLDSDMYPIANHHIESFTTIGKKKQEILLTKLQGENSIKRLIKGNKLLGSGDTFEFQGEIKSRLSYRSNSQLSSTNSIQAEELKSSSRGSSNRRDSSKLIQYQIKKSISQKAIKYFPLQISFNKNDTIVHKSQQKLENYEQSAISVNKPIRIEQAETKKIKQEEVIAPPVTTQKKRKELEQDMETIMRMQLEQIDQDTHKFLSQQEKKTLKSDFEKVYLQDELKKQLAELHKLRQQDSDEEVPMRAETQLHPVLHRSSNNPLQKVSIQNYDHDIESDQDNSDADLAERGQQITQMMTNSLALQFLVEMAKYPESILKKFKQIAMKKSKIKRAPPKPKKNGFQTNQAQIKGFIQDLCSYVLNEQPQIFKNLERATGPSALQMLKYMHQSVEDDIYLDEQEDDPSVMILPNWIFQNFWAKKATTIKYERQGLEQQRQKQRQQYLKGLNKIFLRSCFDCLNQCLDYQRNYGPFGKPFPWKKSHYFQHTKTLQQTRKNVANSQKRLFEISSTYCGIIIQKQQILTLCGNQEYVAQVQEDRLSRMLAQDLVEGEQRWIFYDDEETELLVEASNVIFYQLIQQITGILYGIKPNHLFF